MSSPAKFIALQTTPLGALAPAASLPLAAPAARQSLLKSYLELGKARLSTMVVITTAVGYIVAARQTANFRWDVLLWTCLGTFLAALGASAFNQVIEAPRDARMNRTRKRPLPMHYLSRMHALYFALLGSIAGVAILCPTSNGLTASLCTANILIYVLVYTPLKPLTSANTLIGAVVGGIPPMMGWAAAGGRLDAGAWLLGSILFAWQIPHFLALAWMYREDYARGGYKMLPVIEPSGRLTGLLAMLYSLALIPLAVSLLLLGIAGPLFAGGATFLGLALFAFALQLARHKTRQNARHLFLASVAYLPLLMTLLVLDARGPLDHLQPTPAGYALPSATPFINPSTGR